MSQTSARPHRWLQFRLRAMLAVVLVLSLPLSWLAVRLEKARTQKEVVRELRRLDGEVLYDWNAWEKRRLPNLSAPARAASWSRDILGDDFFDKVEDVYVSGPAVNDVVVARLVSQLHDLRVLTLSCTTITDEGLEKVASLELLERMHLSSESVTNEGLKDIGRLCSLRCLSLRGCRQISDSGMNHIASIPELRILDLSGTQITDAGLRRLARLSHLETLALHQTIVTADGVSRLRALLPECEIYFSPPFDPNAPPDDPFECSSGQDNLPVDCFGP